MLVYICFIFGLYLTLILSHKPHFILWLQHAALTPHPLFFSASNWLYCAKRRFEQEVGGAVLLTVSVGFPLFWHYTEKRILKKPCLKQYLEHSNVAVLHSIKYCTCHCNRNKIIRKKHNRFNLTVIWFTATRSMRDSTLVQIVTFFFCWSQISNKK